MNTIEYNNLVKHAKSVLEKAGIDGIEPTDIVDEIYDPTLTYWENKELLDEKLREIVPADGEGESSRMLDKVIAEMQSEQDVNRLISELGDVYARIVVGREPKEYPKRGELAQMIRVLLHSDTFHGLLVVGERGIGKSYNTKAILREIAESGELPIKVHEIKNSTAHGLLTVLKEIEGDKEHTHVILYEETTIFKADRLKAIHIFNQLLETEDRRTVRYISQTTQKEGIAETIDVSNVKVIIISNEEDFGTDETAEALRSRMLTYNYTMNLTEKVKASYIAFKHKVKGLNDAQKRGLFAIYLTLLKNIAERLPISEKQQEKIKKKNGSVEMTRYQLIGHAINNRLALRFADYYKANGLKYAIEQTTKDVLNLLAEYRDAGAYDWQTYRAMHPTVSKRGYYRRKSIMENIGNVFQANTELGEVVRNIVKSVVRASKNIAPCHDSATTVPQPCQDRATFKKVERSKSRKGEDI